MNYSLGLGRIFLQPDLNLRLHGPKSEALIVQPCSCTRTCMDLCLDLPGQCSQVLKLGVGCEGVPYTSMIIPCGYYCKMRQKSIYTSNLQTSVNYIYNSHCASMPITESIQIFCGPSRFLCQDIFIVSIIYA